MIEIDFSIEASILDEFSKYENIDIFDILSFTKEVNLHCYFASFEKNQSLYRPLISKDKECLFSAQIPITNDFNERFSKSKSMKEQNLRERQHWFHELFP